MDATRNDESRSTPVARRIRDLGAYLFADLDRKKAQALAQGRDVIDLGVGDPDLPTFDHIVERLTQAAKDPGNHQYPSYSGKPELRRAIAAYMERRFSVSLDPDKEILVLIGSKEGIAHLAWAMLDPGDRVVVPDPGYPVYRAAAVLAGGQPVSLPLLPERGFLPALEDVPVEVARRARLLYLNYPNNPTAAVASRRFFREALEFARSYDLVVAHDAAYSEIYFGEPPPSFLEVEGARQVALEFHSLSKTFNMTGWRIGFAVGSPELIGLLRRVKTNVDSGAFEAVQAAAAHALRFVDPEPMRQVYRRRREMMLEALGRSRLRPVPSPATFYIWAEVDEESGRAAQRLLEEAGVVVTPGRGFGEHGEGYVRLSLTVDETQLREAAHRLARWR